MFYESIEKIPIDLTGKVAIKLHMGERGNKTHVSPEDVRILVERIEKNGGEPFLFDTTTLYPKARYTPEGYEEVAKENGFGEFRVVIARDDDYVKKDWVPIAKALLQAESLLVLTHGKGHLITGFGGAIKNLGMGCVVKRGKRIIHGVARPMYDESKCVKCLKCIDACINNLITYDSRKNKLIFNLKDCPGCGLCVEACKTKALRSREISLEESFELFSKAAKAVISLFDKNHIAYINVLKNITEFCDCCSDPGRIVCEDIGYLTGDNPLHLDSESVRLIKGRNPNALDFKRWELFERVAREYF
jgi:hypothetical protein